MAGKGGFRWRPTGNKNPAWLGGLITDEAWFKQKYDVERLSLRQIAKLADRSVRTAARWAEKHGIKMRNHAAARRLTGVSGAANPNWKPHLDRNCVDCGLPVKSPLNRPQRCSGCDRSYRSRIYRGAGNPNFKGIIDISTTIRMHSNDTWRPRVFARDAFTCQKCGDASGGNLRAHHIVRFECLVDEALSGVSLVTGYRGRKGRCDRIPKAE